jgi:hypothetical protein
MADPIAADYADIAWRLRQLEAAKAPKPTDTPPIATTPDPPDYSGVDPWGYGIDSGYCC